MGEPRFEEIEVGLAPEPLVVGPVTRTDFVRYQGASGDMNPVHHDEVFAKAAGFPGPLGVGMWPAGTACAWAAAWLGPERVRRSRIRWKSAVFAGDTLTFTAKVSGTDEQARRVDVELTCTKDEGVVALQCWMSFDFSR